MKTILVVFWRIYLNIFWISLWMLTSLVIWNLNITVITTLKYCYKEALNKKLKLMGGAMNYFLKKLMDHEIFRSMVSWATKEFLKNLQNLQPSFYILNVRSLMLICDQYCKRSLTIGRITQWRNQRKTVSLKFTVVSNFNFTFYYSKILKSCLTYHISVKVYFRGVKSHVIIAVKLFNTWHTLQWSLSLFVMPDPLCNKNCWVKLKDHHQQTHATL